MSRALSQAAASARISMTAGSSWGCAGSKRNLCVNGAWLLAMTDCLLCELSATASYLAHTKLYWRHYRSALACKQWARFWRYNCERIRQKLTQMPFAGLPLTQEATVKV